MSDHGPEPTGEYEQTVKVTYSWRCPRCEDIAETRTFLSTELIEREMVAHTAAYHPDALEQVKQWCLDGAFTDKDTVMPPSEQGVGPHVVEDAETDCDGDPEQEQETEDP